MTLIRTRIAAEAGLTSTSRERVQIAGISNSESVPAQRTFINELAVGDSANVLPSGHRALTVSSLPTGIDGVLDPTTAYAPLGYVIDLPRRQLLAFDTNTNRLRSGTEPAGGAVVRWVRERGGTRPFVRLGDNRLALIDTGSGFGLAIAQGRTASGANYSERAIRDLSGGAIKSNRVAPSTVTIGSLVLRGVPTDVLIGAHDAAPVLLGRDALYPFRITFDPASLLIEIVPSE
jgi:hypothetical protein